MQQSRTILGHYDASHHAIAISRRLDRAEIPAYVVEYVLYHEMLHIKHPVEHKGTSRRIHTRSFQQEEKLFVKYQEAKAYLKKGLR
jgi:predicted metal-dependent hydrolase